MDAAAMVITAVVAGGSAYLGSYLKKKGANWATHEDVDKLVLALFNVAALQGPPMEAP